MKKHPNNKQLASFQTTRAACCYILPSRLGLFRVWDRASAEISLLWSQTTPNIKVEMKAKRNSSLLRARCCSPARGRRQVGADSPLVLWDWAPQGLHLPEAPDAA